MNERKLEVDDITLQTLLVSVLDISFCLETSVKNIAVDVVTM
jgi:hypothetical protein